MSMIFTTAASQYRAMRREWQDVLEAQYAAAEEATNGYLVNARGLERGWTGWRLFTAPPTAVRAYASPELTEHLAANPRTTLRAFEAQWFDPEGGAA